MFTILPDLALRITGSTACIALSAPKTFTAIIFSRSSGAHGLDRLRDQQAGRVYQDVDFAEGFLDLFDRPEHACAIGHLAIECERLAAGLVDFRRELFELHATPCEQRDLRALFAERERDVVPDAARRAGHDHRFVEEVAAHRSFGFPLGFAHGGHLDWAPWHGTDGVGR